MAKPHTSLLPLILSAVLALLIGKDLLLPGFFSSHDGLFHVVRLQQFDQSFRAGQIPVRWAPTLLGGLGYPLFVVNYNLPYYLAEGIFLISGSLFTAIKYSLLLSLVGGAITSFWLLYVWTKNEWAAFTGAFLYTIAPYRLANIFERGALGESVAYIFIPLLFLGVHKIHQHKSPLFFAIALALLNVSHTVVVLTFLPLAITYAIVFSTHRYHTIRKLVIGIIVAAGISAFQLFPSLFERQYMRFDENLLTSYIGHFKTLYQLLRIPKSGVNLGTRFQVGLSHTLIWIAGVMIIMKKKFTPATQKLAFFAAVTLVSLWLITTASQWLWQHVTPLQLILYPWRFLGIIVFTTSTIGAYLAANTKHYQATTACIIALALITNHHYLKIDQTIPAVFPQHLLSGNATTQNEFDPIWFKPTALMVTPGKTRINTLFFPGWKIYIDGHQIPIAPANNGFIEAQIPPGTHTILTKFSETPVRKIGDTVSAIAILSVITYYVLRLRPH